MLNIIQNITEETGQPPSGSYIGSYFPVFSLASQVILIECKENGVVYFRQALLIRWDIGNIFKFLCWRFVTSKVSVVNNNTH